MAPLPGQELDLNGRLVVGVSADPHVWVDTDDYSIDPAMVGRWVEMRVSQRQITAIRLDTGEPRVPGSSACDQATGRVRRAGAATVGLWRFERA